MYALSLLQTWFARNCDFIHEARAKAVVKVVRGLVDGGKAVLTEIGRHVRAGRYEKHGIKCADRMVGNLALHSARIPIYAALSSWLLSRTERPWIIVDWSDVALSHRYLMLKAAVPVGGRAVTIYEEVHPLKRYNNPKAHQRFLERLKTVVPGNCRPIIITDAGFRGPWFEAVAALGWDWIGRVRNEVKYRMDDGGAWKYTRSLYYRATDRPSYLGRAWLSHKRPYLCQLHLYKALKRGPGRPRKALRAVPNAKRAREHAREPWLLATSLPIKHWSARRVVSAYEKRMQIEETFRDLKSHRWGYGLQYARSRSPERLENLLLLTTLALLATWLAGLAVKAANLARHFQANTVREKAALSVIFLGRRVLKGTRTVLHKQAIHDAMRTLPFLIHEHSQHA